MLARELFRAFWADPSLLPGAYAAEALAASDSSARGTVIVDYISGMTDGYAEEELRLVVVTSPNVRARQERPYHDGERSEQR